MSEHKPDAVLVRDVAISMRDGVQLRGDLWRPADGLAPTVLFRTPYDRRTLNSDALRVSHCLDHGYAVLVQDTRGRFGSEGDWAPLMWDHEGPDGHDTVEWVAAQGWSDGRVFMAGASYLGIAQWLTALEQPPHLTAIAPGLTTSYELDQRETGGIPRLDHVVSWYVFMLADFLARRAAAGDATAVPRLQEVMVLAHDPTPALTADPPGAVPALMLPEAPLTLDALLTGTPTIPGYDYDRVKVPTLSVGCWYDVFIGGTIRSFQQMAARGNGHRLVIGPWTHASALGHVQGQQNFGLAAAGSVARLPEQHLDFFSTADHPATSVTWFLMGADTWHTSQSWPPPGTVRTALHLSSNGLVESPLACSPTTWRHEPSHPVPTHGGRVLNLGRLAAGPLDQRWLMERQDVCVFQSSTLDQPLIIAGEIALELSFVSSAAQTDLVAKLLVVHEDGTALPVAQGCLRTAPGRVMLDLAHTAVQLRPGQRLGLMIASSDFPHLAVHPEPAEQRLLHDAAQPCTLYFDVLPASAL